MISPRLAELALGAALIDRLESIRWQTVADVLTAGGSPTEYAAALDLHAPATRSHELRAWADIQRAHALMSENDQRRIVLRRDPPPGRGHRSGHRSAARRDHLHLVGAVLDRASRGWRGFTMTPAGLRLLQDLRRALLEPPPSYDTPARPTPTSPTPSGSWPNIDRQREDLYVRSFTPLVRRHRTPRNGRTGTGL